VGSPITVTPKQPIKALHKDRWVCLRLPKGTAWKYGPGIIREDGPVFQLKIAGWADSGERTTGRTLCQGFRNHPNESHRAKPPTGIHRRSHKQLPNKR